VLFFLFYFFCDAILCHDSLKPLTPFNFGHARSFANAHGARYLQFLGGHHRSTTPPPASSAMGFGLRPVLYAHTRPAPMILPFSFKPGLSNRFACLIVVCYGDLYVVTAVTGIGFRRWVSATSGFFRSAIATHFTS
jgi:hypothetical protein